jgi:hypothetical protein
MARLCGQLAESATKHNPAGRGPWIWRSSIPGATYAKAIDGRGRGRRRGAVETSTVLAFHLVFWLRAITTPGGLIVGDGAPMPTTGKPHYDIAAAFVCCAFDDETLTARNVEDRVKAVPDLQYMSWKRAGLVRESKRAGA